MNARILLAACLCIAPSGGADAAERRIDLSSFDSVRVEGAFVVHLITAASPRGMMHGDPAALRQTEAAIVGSTLVIRTLRDGTPRLLARCTLPITARGVVTLVATDLGLFAPMGEGFAVRDLAPGVTLEDVRAATPCPVSG